MTAFDIEAVRARFPGLARTRDGRPCLFADGPGGTQVVDTAIDAMARYLRERNANTGGAFDTSRETDALIASARGAAADLLGCDAGEVVFGPNMTTLSFALSRAVARTLRPGDEVVVTRLDHDANVAPWLVAAEDTGATVRRVDLRDQDCTLDLESLDAALSGRTRVVAFTLASNAAGTVPPAGEVVARVRTVAPDALVVADAVHAAPHRFIDARSLGVDALFCSPYKFFGPHLGVMFLRADVLASLRPDRVRPAPDVGPERWERGTLCHEALAGLIEAVGYLAWLGAGAGGAEAVGPGRRTAIQTGMRAVRRHEETLSRCFLAGAGAVPGLRLFGIDDPGRVGERTPTFALRLGDQHPRRTAEALAGRGIFVWDGNYYALEVMRRLGLEASGGAVRVGFCHYNTMEEVERVLAEVRDLA
jgi:cysteine desulfurase family protein (TIGR01976 family)